jgi:hypothetical protein
MGWDYTCFYTETIQNFSHLLADDKPKNGHYTNPSIPYKKRFDHCLLICNNA